MSDNIQLNTIGFMINGTSFGDHEVKIDFGSVRVTDDSLKEGMQRALRLAKETLKRAEEDLVSLESLWGLSGDGK